MGDKTYSIRTPDHQIVGGLHRQDVIEGIRSGRYTGEEDVSLEQGVANWSKLASHPQFYDEFLRRLFNTQYGISKVVETDAGSQGRVAGDEAGALTRVSKAAPAVEVPPHLDHGEATENKHGALTIHESEIEALFSIKTIPHVESSRNTHHTSSVKAAPDTELRGEPVAHPRAGSPILKVSCLVLLLAGLYYLGVPSSNLPTVLEEQPGGSGDTHEGSQQSVVSGSDALLERYSALIGESDELFRLDVLAFLDGAEKLLQSAIQIDSGRIDAYSRLALVLSRTYTFASVQRRAAIEKRFRSVVKTGRSLEPQLTDFYVAEGEVALANGDFVEAQKLATYAQQTSPGGFLGEQLAFAVDVARGGSLAALDRVRKLSIPQSHRNRMNYLAGLLEKRLNRSVEARATLLGVLRENPLHVASYMLLGEVFSDQNQLKDARAAFETAGRLHRLDGGGNTGQAFLRRGEIEIALGVEGPSERSLRLAYYYGVEPQKLVAIRPTLRLDRELIRDEAIKEEYDSNYFYDQGTVLLAENNYPAAALFFRAAHRDSVKSAAPLLKLGIAIEAMAKSLDQLKVAAIFYRDSITLNPSLVEAYIRLGSLETARYNFEQAYTVLQQAAAIDSQSPEVSVAFGKHFYNRQDYQASLVHFLNAKKTAPFNSEVFYYAGLLVSRFSKEQLREAMAMFYKAYTLDLKNYDALVEWLRLKVVYYEKNFAIKFVSALIDKNPRNAHYRWALGEIYAANNEFHRAIRHYHTALDIDNRNSKVRMALAKSLRAVGELEAAVEEYRLASKLDIFNGNGFFHASEVNMTLRNYPEAYRDISALLSVFPSYPGARQQMARIYQLTGKQDAALAEMRREVDHNPLNTKYRQELAEMLYNYHNFSEAVTELSHIVNLPNRNQAPEYTNDKVLAYLWLSRSYRALSQFDGAEGAIRLALELDSNRPDLHREQGFVYRGQNREKEAAVAFESYLRRSPAAADAQEIRKIIGELVIEE